MAYGDTQGIHLPYASTNANGIPFDVMWMAINFYPQRCPLMFQLMKKPLGALSFYMNSDTYRPRTQTLNAAYTSAGATLTVLDTTGIDVGDVLNIESERFIVTAIPSATTLTVVGAQEGTTQANHANAVAVTIVTNARTGGEVDQNALSRLLAGTVQYSQTSQKAYQISGSLQSATNFLGGRTTPLDRDRQMAVQHVMDDFERGMYYGKGQALSSTVTRQTMKGLATLLTTNTSSQPTNYTAYKPSDFTRDLLQSAFTAGGKPNIILVSPQFLGGLSTWGFNLQLLPAGATELGVQIEEYTVPFLGGVKLIPAPLLDGYTAIALNTDEVSIALKRRLDVYPRGRRGDAEEGDVIMEGAIDVENESHHAYVSGITGFAVQS
jgi:hypothetical protein